MKIIIVIIGWCFLCCAGLKAQNTISGVVTDRSKKPVPYASVYLSQTTMGAITNDKGAYSLNVPPNGTYELICSCVGYESFSQIIKVDGKPWTLNIELSEHVVMISEITVMEKDVNRPQNYEKFKTWFLGMSYSATLCKIKNPEDLIVYRDSQDSNLIAYSVKPLVIINSHLGYKIHYDLKYFRLNLHDHRLRLAGDYYFEDLTNPKRINLQTNKNRLLTYYGSRMHFLRALFTDSLSEENFEICAIGTDSCNTRVITHSMNAKEVRLAVNTDSMTLYYCEPLYISYKENHRDLDLRPFVYRPEEHLSWMGFNDTLQVYKDGYYPGIFNISWAGTMGNKRIADLLPYDYVPKPIKKVFRLE
ncbi:MAG TPA: carboxypeptidase-like regulatory domain-containing protein [Prolixibacteraceae bacterium]|nr:carboxypeptidase-like regulatory domain-containing protein [Prolixibacteraceae bacterium]